MQAALAMPRGREVCSARQAVLQTNQDLACRGQVLYKP